MKNYPVCNELIKQSRLVPNSSVTRALAATKPLVVHGSDGNESPIDRQVASTF